MVHKLRKITHNTLYQLFGKVAAVSIGLITLRVIIGYLSPEEYGSYATAIAFLTFFSVIADMGLYLVMVQEIAKPGTYVQKKDQINLIFSLRVLSALIIFGLAPLMALFFHYQPQTFTLILIGTIAFFPLATNQVLVGIFQKEFATNKIVLSELVGRLLFLGLIIGVVRHGGAPHDMMIALVIGNSLYFGLTWFFARKYTKLRFFWDAKRANAIIKRAWPLAVVIMLNLVYFRIDAIMLSKMQGEIPVAIYSVAYKVLEIVTIIPTLILGLILPLLSSYAASKQSKKFQATFESTLFAILTIGIPVIIGGILLAQPIIELLSGGKFQESAQVLQLLMIAVGMIFLGNLFNHGVIALEKQKGMTWVYVVGAVASIATNAIAIPYYSYTGAAVTTILVEALVMVLVGRALFRFAPWKWPVAQIIRVCSATLLMGIILWYIQPLPLILAILIGAVSYVGALYCIGGIPRQFLATLLPPKR